MSFSKLLCVSSQFCDQHHRLLFKILETSKDADIKSNIVIALGDVAVSFSNIIDENSNELYKGLSDKDLRVKKNTLMVLTHLILNGMIKVKGQLGEMAKCLEDPEPRIADLAKLFFKELSSKENAIYNNLPDGKIFSIRSHAYSFTLFLPVISHLSTGEHAVDEETFKSILKYIFTFIEKVSRTARKSPILLAQSWYRKNKQRTSSRNSASDSSSRRMLVNGGTLRSVSHCSHSSRSGQ